MRGVSCNDVCPNSLCDLTKVWLLLDLVHRDLAARNVLIGRGLQAKVSDYGFSRHTAIKMESESCYYKMRTMRALPVRWTVRWRWKVVERDCEGVCSLFALTTFCLVLIRRLRSFSRARLAPRQMCGRLDASS